jgi:hypothetical protein
MKTRLIENWITTVMGLGLIAFSCYMYAKNENLEAAIAFGGWGFTFLRAKDSLIGLDHSK